MKIRILAVLLLMAAALSSCLDSHPSTVVGNPSGEKPASLNQFDQATFGQSKFQ